AAHNMICAPANRRPHVAVPAFWSGQFGVNIKSVGVPPAAEEIVITQGSLDDDEPRFVAAYGTKDGRVVAAVAFNQAKWLGYHQRLSGRAAPSPSPCPVGKSSGLSSPVPAGFPDPREPRFDATVVLTGHDPNEQRVAWRPRESEHTAAPS